VYNPYLVQVLLQSWRQPFWNQILWFGTYICWQGGGTFRGAVYEKNVLCNYIRYKHVEARIIWSFCVLTIIGRYLPTYTGLRRLHYIVYILYIYIYKSTTGNTIRIFQLISFFLLLLVNWGCGASFQLDRFWDQTQSNGRTNRNTQYI